MEHKHSQDDVRSENHTHKRALDAGAKAQQERMMAPEARTTLTRRQQKGVSTTHGDSQGSAGAREPHSQDVADRAMGPLAIGRQKREPHSQDGTRQRVLILNSEGDASNRVKIGDIRAQVYLKNCEPYPYIQGVAKVWRHLKISHNKRRKKIKNHISDVFFDEESNGDLEFDLEHNLQAPATQKSIFQMETPIFYCRFEKSEKFHVKIHLINITDDICCKARRRSASLAELGIQISAGFSMSPTATHAPASLAALARQTSHLWEHLLSALVASCTIYIRYQLMITFDRIQKSSKQCSRYRSIIVFKHVTRVQLIRLIQRVNMCTRRHGNCTHERSDNNFLSFPRSQIFENSREDRAAVRRTSNEKRGKSKEGKKFTGATHLGCKLTRTSHSLEMLYARTSYTPTRVENPDLLEIFFRRDSRGPRVQKKTKKAKTTTTRAKDTYGNNRSERKKIYTRGSGIARKGNMHCKIFMGFKNKRGACYPILESEFFGRARHRAVGGRNSTRSKELAVDCESAPGMAPLPIAGKIFSTVFRIDARCKPHDNFHRGRRGNWYATENSSDDRRGKKHGTAATARQPRDVVKTPQQTLWKAVVESVRDASHARVHRRKTIGATKKK
ncbi:unnamed protein product [Trichogramma brassicae]|uniref:Uncharacterized protein n=1 Tax=Trichogramma brassicae TaxID=86971 RepID=A0A6H5ID65_9HYME|nr:unnamed protein product [Trichogramma brassicae]